MQRTNLTTFVTGPRHARSRKRSALPEHSRIATTQPIRLEDGRSLPEGAKGVVVGIWSKGEAYEVEVTDPFHAVVTMTAEQVLHLDR